MPCRASGKMNLPVEEAKIGSLPRSYPPYVYACCEWQVKLKPLDAVALAAARAHPKVGYAPFADVLLDLTPVAAAGLPDSPITRHSSWSDAFFCGLKEASTSHRSIASSV